MNHTSQLRQHALISGKLLRDTRKLKTVEVEENLY